MNTKRRSDLAVRIFGFVLILLGTGWLFVQTSEVQTGIAERVLKKLEADWQGKVELGSVSVELVNSFKITDIAVLDNAPYSRDNPVDTLFKAKSISGKISMASLLGGGVYFSRVRLQDALFHLAIEPDSSRVLGTRTNLNRIFGFEKKELKGYASTPDLFQIKKLSVNGIRYRMTNYVMPIPHRKGGINWSDLDVAAKFKAHNVKYTGGRMSGIVDRFSAKEKSGYVIKSLTGRARVGMGKATIEKIHLIDEWSDIKVPLYSMGWNNVKYDFHDFLNKIRQELIIDSGTLSAHSIHAFADIPDVDITLQMGKSHAKGYLSDMEIDRLRFTEPLSGIKGDVSAILIGIPDIQNLLTDAKINNLTFTTKGLQRLLKHIGIKAKLSTIAPTRVFSLSAKAKGPLNRLDVTGNLGSRIGRAKFRAAIRDLSNPKRPTYLKGTLNTRNLGLGELLSQKALGDCTAETGFRATLGKKGPSIILDSLLVDKLGVNGYEYTGIRAQGKYSAEALEGRLICVDHNLNLMLQGNSKTGGAFNFSGSIAYADLQAINIDRRGKSRISGSIDADFHNRESGILSIHDLTVENELGRKELGDISMEAIASGDNYMLNLRSSFANGEYFGNRNIFELFNSLQDISIKRELSALYPAGKAKISDKDMRCDLSLSLGDTRDLLSYLLPGLYVADSTALMLEVGEYGGLSANLNSSLVVWRSNYLKNLDINFDNFDSSLNALVLSEEMNLNDISFSNVALTAYAKDNSMFTGFSYDGIKGIDNLGELYITAELSRDKKDRICINARPLSSFLRFGGQQWNIEESLISWRYGMAKIDGFRIHNGKQSLSIDGGISMNSADTLAIDVSNVDLSVINYFTRQNYDIGGRTSGTAVISSPLNGGMQALGFLNCDSLMVGGASAGIIRAAGVWDSKGDKVNLFVRNLVDGNEAIKASGIYHPTTRNLELKANLDGMNLIMAQPFVGKYLSELSGGLTGTVYASGNIDSLKIYSQNTSIDYARMKVAPTGVSYTINGPFHIDNSGLHFDDIAIADDNSGRAVLSGGIAMRSLSDMSFNSNLRLYSLELLKRSGSEVIGGNLFANGNIYISGPPSAILLDADIMTAGDGSLHVPINSLNSAQNSNLLSFTQHDVKHDPYEDILAELITRREMQKKKNSESEFMARLRVTTTPNTEAILDLDKTGDNMLRFRGDGVININLRPAKEIFDISGDYNINEGSYRFSLPGVSKDFTIDSGSSISFGGDLLESNLDIGATYTLRTSLNKFLADTSSVSNRREVQCGIHIADKLMAPTVSFSINIPDLDPSTKAKVESALNTEDKIQKQFIALLVTGSFIPDEQSGIVNNPNILYSNVSEIMSRQLSDMLSRLDIPLDMGLGYQQNTSGTDLFDVAISTQLFNKRVEVHGSVGNRQNTTGTAATPYGDVVGDLDIDWKINRSGQLRLNAFSHSADEYSSYLDNTQRNGVGITYQKEFGTWDEFLRNLFSSKKKREEREAAKLGVKQEQKKVSIHE